MDIKKLPRSKYERLTITLFGGKSQKSKKVLEQLKVFCYMNKGIWYSDRYIKYSLFTFSDIWLTKITLSLPVKYQYYNASASMPMKIQFIPKNSTLEIRFRKELLINGY